MITGDNEILWRPRRLYIPVNQFTGLLPVTTIKGGAAGTAVGYDADTAAFKLTKAAATDRASFVVSQMGTPAAAADPSTVVLRQVSTAGVVGMLMSTAADEAQHFQLLPWDLDITKNIYVYAHWTCEAAAVGARTVTWRVRYTKIVPNVTALVASPATVLDTVIGAQAPLGTALTFQRTTDALAGTIIGGSFANNVHAIQLRVDMSAFNAAVVENKYLLGLELVYTPKLLAYPGVMQREAKRSINMLDSTYS